MPRRIKISDNDAMTREETVAAIYCRVSTKEQGESGLSLEHQEQRCKSYCDAKGWKIYETFIEVASAGNMERPKLQQLFNDGNNGKFNVLVAWRLDRISRVPKDYYYIIEEFDKLNIDISMVEGNVDTTRAEGRMLLGILLQFASFERELGKERTSAGMEQKAIRGEFLGGPPILGYDLLDKKLLINKEGSEIVVNIFNQYIKGGGPSEIARFLNSRGHKTKKYITKKSIERGGLKFTRNYVHNVIINLRLLLRFK